MGVPGSESSIIAGAAGQSSGGASFYDYQIEQSARFDASTPSYLRLASGSGNNDYWTLSFWFKTGALPSGTSQEFLSSGTGGSSNSDTLLRIGLLDESNGAIIRVNSGSSNIADSSAKFRDASTWSHLVWSNSNGTTKVYVNGTEIANGTLDGGSGSAINGSSAAHYISRGRQSDSKHVDGYLAEMIMISHTTSAGTLLPTSFAEEHRGVWRPIDISGLAYKDWWLKFENASDLGNDSSGNNRDWTVTGMGTDHQVLDSPTFGS